MIQFLKYAEYKLFQDHLATLKKRLVVTIFGQVSIKIIMTIRVDKTKLFYIYLSALASLIVLISSRKKQQNQTFLIFQLKNSL